MSHVRTGNATMPRSPYLGRMDEHTILETLAALGQAHESDTKGAYVR